MVPKIPVSTWKIFNIGSHSYEASAGIETPMDFVEGASQRGFVGQVFEEITCEYQVQAAVGYGPALRAVLEETFNPGRKLAWRVRIEVHGELGSAADLVNENAVAATKVKNRIGGANVGLKDDVNENTPDTLAIAASG